MKTFHYMVIYQMEIDSWKFFDAKQVLQQKTDQFKFVSESSQNLVIVFNRGSVFYQSKEAEEFFGSSFFQEIVTFEYFDKPEHCFISEVLASLDKQKASITDMGTIRRNSGSLNLFFHAWCQKIEWENRMALILNLIDVSFIF